MARSKSRRRNRRSRKRSRRSRSRRSKRRRSRRSRRRSKHRRSRRRSKHRRRSRRSRKRSRSRRSRRRSRRSRSRSRRKSKRRSAALAVTGAGAAIGLGLAAYLALRGESGGRRGKRGGGGALRSGRSKYKEETIDVGRTGGGRSRSRSRSRWLDRSKSRSRDEDGGVSSSRTYGGGVKSTSERVYRDSYVPELIDLSRDPEPRPDSGGGGGGGGPGPAATADDDDGKLTGDILRDTLNSKAPGAVVPTAEANKIWGQKIMIGLGGLTLYAVGFPVASFALLNLATRWGDADINDVLNLAAELTHSILVPVDKEKMKHLSDKEKSKKYSFALDTVMQATAMSDINEVLTQDQKHEIKTTDDAQAARKKNVQEKYDEIKNLSLDYDNIGDWLNSGDFIRRMIPPKWREYWKDSGAKLDQNGKLTFNGITKSGNKQYMSILTGGGKKDAQEITNKVKEETPNY